MKKVYFVVQDGKHICPFDYQFYGVFRSNRTKAIRWAERLKFSNPDLHYEVFTATPMSVKEIK